MGESWPSLVREKCLPDAYHQPSISPTFLPPFPCIWQGFAKPVELAWTWEVLGYTLGRAWVQRGCTLGGMPMSTLK